MIPDESKIKDLIRLSSEGNTSAFRDIVKIFSKYLFVAAFRILGNENDAKDITQDAFIRVWKHISEYNGKVKFTTWLYKIVINLCYDRLKYRKRKIKIMVSQNDLPDEDNINGPVLQQDYSNIELAKLIENISEGLPEKQRIIFSLRDLQGFSIDETAELTNLSISSVKTNLVFARRAIKNKLDKCYGVRDWK